MPGGAWLRWHAMIAGNESLNPVRLCPAQQRAFDELLRAVGVGDVFVLKADGGAGRTTVLHAAHARLGGAFVSIKQVVEAMQHQHPLSIEEQFYRVVWDALTKHDCVIIDDLHKLALMTHPGCGSYPRAGWLDATLLALATYAAESDTKLIFGSDAQMTPQSIRDRCYFHAIGDFKAADYDFLCRVMMGDEPSAMLDFHKISGSRRGWMGTSSARRARGCGTCATRTPSRPTDSSSTSARSTWRATSTWKKCRR